MDKCGTCGRRRCVCPPTKFIVIYTWSDGREEIRYNWNLNYKDTPKLKTEVDKLRAQFGSNCPYNYRYEK